MTFDPDTIISSTYVVPSRTGRKSGNRMNEGDVNEDLTITLLHTAQPRSHRIPDLREKEKEIN